MRQFQNQIKALGILLTMLTTCAGLGRANVAEMTRTKEGAYQIYEDLVGNDGTTSNDLTFSVDFNFRSENPATYVNSMRVKVRCSNGGLDGYGGYAAGSSYPGLLIQCDMDSSSEIGANETLSLIFHDGSSATTLGTYNIPYNAEWRKLTVIYDDTDQTASLKLNDWTVIEPVTIDTTNYDMSGRYFYLESGRYGVASTDGQSVLYDNIEVTGGISEDFESLTNLSAGGDASWVTKNRYDFWNIDDSLDSDFLSAAERGPRLMENLNRGLFAVDLNSGSGNYVGWRLLGTDDADVSFNLYRDGTSLTGALSYVTGQIGEAIDMDGSAGLVTLPAGIFDVDDITIATWVYWDGGDDWQRIFDFGNDTSSYMFLTPNSPDSTLRFAIVNGGSEEIVETTALNTATWTHVAVTLSGDTATLYVNGASAATNSSATINPSDFNPSVNYIGDSQWPADPLFDGRIDDFRVYGSALSSADIASLASGSTPSATPIVLYDMDGDLSDSSGNGYDATGTGGPITASTNYQDTGGSSSSTYYVKPVIGGIEQDASESVTPWANCYNNGKSSYYYKDLPYHELTLTTRTGYGDSAATSGINDAGAGDLDGDGEYEIVVKRIPDDISATATDFTLIEAYELDGTLMWTIDLGPNNLFAPYENNPIVYDLDGDGKAEVVLRTCEGNTDGLGVTIGDTDSDGQTDYRDSAVLNSGSYYMIEGPEFLSIFDGENGGELARTDYIERDPISNWGTTAMTDSQNGHRADKCMMTPAYLDGQRPSIVICRGIYHRTAMQAWDWRDGALTQRWDFDTIDWDGYDAQGNHNLTVGDVDNDGRDEIVYASMTVNDDGTGLYTTELGHGDALHMSDMLPDRDGLEIFQCHEASPYGTTLRDAFNGDIFWRLTATGDTGRCGAAHIDADYKGFQLWSSASGGTFDAATQYADSSNATPISTNQAGSGNFMVWWDDDLQREIFDGAGSGTTSPKVEKWNDSDGVDRLISLYNVPSSYANNCINYSKSNPCLIADILGDWREEILVRSSDNTKIYIFSTAEVATTRFPTLMHDCQYREAVAWQCNMYNQPPHPSYYIGAEMTYPVDQPNIVTNLAALVPVTLSGFMID